MNLYFIAGSIGDSIKNWFQDWFGAILSFIPKTFYQLLTPIYAIMDAMQWIMRKIAGLDTIYKFNDQTNIKGDIVMQFMNMIFTGSSPVLANIFWSMIILGVLMLILTTMIAVVRSEYTATDSKSASKGKIIGNSLKALASFAIVPIVCFFGMFLCNVILQALDKVSTGSTSVTQTTINTTYFKPEKTTTGEQTYNNYTFFGFTVPTTTTPISGLVFKAAAYSANRARINGSFYEEMLNNDKVSANGAFSQNKGTDSNSVYQNCWLMDEAFANCFQLKTKTKIDRDPFKKDHMHPPVLNIGITIAESILISAGYTHFDKNNTALVWYYYDLWSFDFIIAIGALVIITGLLLYLVFGLFKRIFELTILFLVAAPISSLMPLDGGNALKKWREKFVAKTIGVYGPIVGLNLFFVILALLQTLELTGIAIIDKIVNLLFTIAGLAMVKDFTKMLSELVGGEDTLGAGADKAKEIGATAAKVGKTTAAFTGAGLAVMKAGSLTSKAVAGGKLAKNSSLKQKAEEGEGRYAKGSASYDNAVTNMADNVTDDEARDAAKKAGAFTYNNLGELDFDMEKGRRLAAQDKLDNMDWRDRQAVIDANHRSRGQNERIRNRAIAAAGGIDAYRSMSSGDRNALFNDSKHGNWQNPLGKALEKGVSDKARRTSSIDGAKIELGESSLKALAKSFTDFGKHLGSFTQQTMGAMSGPMMNEMKGLGGTMIQLAQGKQKKDIDSAAEIKNQKKIRSAQNAAEESLGLGKKQPEAPEKPKPTELSDTSINKIGSAIAEKLNKKD